MQTLETLPLLFRPQELHPNPLETRGYIHKTAQHMLNCLDVAPSELKIFQKFWQNLELDPYMADNGTYRLRRFGAFLRSSSGGLKYLGNMPFFQKKSINALNGGVARYFAPLENDFCRNSLLEKIIDLDVAMLPDHIRFRPLLVFVHQVRILAGGEHAGRPTPEGIHQDGHLFVAQHLIDRQNVKGGESTIYDGKKRPIFSATLESPFETVMVNDPEVYHGVSSIESSHGSIGHRDMMLIDFNFPNEV